jgi:preprotein translocase subunit SecE
MSAKLETASTMPDVLKWVFAATLLAAGLVGFYYFGDYSTLLRVIGLLLAVGASVVVAVQTVKGRMAWEFMRDSRTEVRKVVWPTRKETTQTTLIIMGVVTIVALIMWTLDTMLGWMVRVLLGQGG